jgi:hypothetical protein
LRLLIRCPAHEPRALAHQSLNLFDLLVERLSLCFQAREHRIPQGDTKRHIAQEYLTLPLALL